MRSRRTWPGCLLAIFLFFAPEAFASTLLTTVGERVTVYSGPGHSYRPLTTLKANTEVAVSPKVVNSRDGKFYKVLVLLSGDRKAVGYIATSADVRVKSDNAGDEDFGKYSEIGLAKSAIQASFSYHKDRSYFATLGYMYYLSPGFYVKGFGGQWINKTSAAPVYGAEIGNDALLYKRLSGFISYAAGLWFPVLDNDVFKGSRRNDVNFLVKGTAGLRYNAGRAAALSLGPTYTSLFNNNNSLVTFGLNLTLEVGL